MVLPPSPFVLRACQAAGLLLLVTVRGALAGASCPPEPTEYPARFSPLLAIFLGIVEIPAVPVEAGAAGVGAQALRLRVTEPVHLPSNPALVDLVVVQLGQDCAPQALSGADLLARFKLGDVLKVVAQQLGSDPSLLEASEREVSHLLDEGRVRARTVVADRFDYQRTLLTLDAKTSDTEKVPSLAALASYVEDPESFRELVKAHLGQKALRQQLVALYTSLHPASAP